MKKLLLLLCAFVASVSGAWGQTNLASGKTVSVIYLPSGKTAPSNEDLAKVTDGNTGTNVMLPNVENDIAAISIDLTEANKAKEIGIINVSQDGRHATAYTIYGTNDAPGNYATKGDLTTAAASWFVLASTVNDANVGGDNNVYTKSYVAASNSGFRYIVFVPTAKDYNVSLRQIEVIKRESPVLTSIALSSALFVSGSAAAVTVSALDQLSTAYSGSVTYTVSPNTGVSVSANVISFTAEATGTYTITGTDGNSNSATAKVYFFEAAPTLTNSGEDIELIQSEKSHSGEGTGYDGGYTAQTDWDLSDTKIFHATNVKKFYMTNPGIGADALTGYKKLHLKLFSSVAKNGVVVNMEGINAQKTFNVPAGEWTTIEVPFTGGSAASSWIWIKYTEPAESTDAEILVTDMYFSKDAAYVPMVIDSETNGVVAVHGDVKESDITSLSAVTASKLDLTGVSSWTATSAIESPNPNQIIVVGCTYTSTDAANPGVITPAINVANTKNVVAYTGYYFALTPIEITDNNSYQPWSGSINTNYGSNGYTITRTVAADKYVSAYFPTTATNVSVTNGTIYELDATNSTTSEVKFNKVATIGGGAPFIVHTTGDATITVTGSGDLNMGENGGNTAQIAFASDAALFKGNLIAKAGTGVEWGLQSSTGAAPVFKQIGTGATIGSFRAYFTGLSATSSARAIFDDGDGTTAIKSIESIMNQDDVYYNLNGQRVLNPTKGLYIVNGKKVILK